MLSDPALEKLHAMRLTGMANAWREQQGKPDMRKLDFDERVKDAAPPTPTSPNFLATPANNRLSHEFNVAHTFSLPP